jgi:hypothetical protein
VFETPVVDGSEFIVIEHELKLCGPLWLFSVDHSEPRAVVRVRIA